MIMWKKSADFSEWSERKTFHEISTCSEKAVKIGRLIFSVGYFMGQMPLQTAVKLKKSKSQHGRGIYQNMGIFSKPTTAA